MGIFDSLMSGLAGIFRNKDDEERRSLVLENTQPQQNPIFTEDSFRASPENTPSASLAPAAQQDARGKFDTLRASLVDNLASGMQTVDKTLEGTFHVVDAPFRAIGEGASQLADATHLNDFLKWQSDMPLIPQLGSFSPKTGQAAEFVGDTAAAIARSVPRALTSVGQSIGEVINPETSMNVIEPKQDWQKFLFGNEPVKSIQENAKDVSNVEQGIGIPKNIADLTALPLVAAGTLMDLSPLEGGVKKILSEGIEKKAMKEIGEEGVQKGIASLIGNSVDDFKNNIRALSKGTSMGTEADTIFDSVKAAIKEGGKLDDIYTIFKNGISANADEVAKMAAKETVQKGAGMIDDVGKAAADNLPLFPGTKENADDITKKLIDEGAGNIPPGSGVPGAGSEAPANAEDVIINAAGKLEKITKPKYEFDLKSLNTEDDVKITIKNMAIEGDAAIQNQRRGTMTWEQTRKLADSLGMSTEELTKHKPGKIWNAEEADAATRLMLKANEDLTAIGKEINTLQKAGSEIPKELQLKQMEAAARVQGINAAIIGNRSETGRALNAAKMIKDGLADPDKIYEQATKIFAGDGQRAKEVLAKLSQFDPEDTLGKLKFLRDVKPSTAMDKIEELWYNSVLSGTATHVMNQIGNTMSTLMRYPEKIVAGGLDALGEKIAKATGKKYVRDRFAAEAGAEITGMRSGFIDGIRRAISTMKTGLTEEGISKMDIGRVQAIKGPVGDAINTPTRALLAGDELWKGINYQMGIYGQATRIAKLEKLSGEAFTKRVADLVANPDGKMIEEAFSQAKYRLFQSDSGASNALRYFRDNFVKLNIPVLGEIRPLRFIIPFVQVPVNVFKYGMERSPAGFLGAGYKALNGAAKGEVLDQVAKAMIGSTLMVPLAMYATEGKITGAVPSDRAEKDAFYADGKLPWSIKIGDRWHSYQRIEPLNTILTQIALYHDAYEKNEKEINVATISDFLKGIAKNIGDQTFMLGIGNLMNAMEDPGRYGEKALTDIIGGFIPSLVAAGARSIDDTPRKPGSILESFETRLPLLSKNVPGYDSKFEPGGVAVRHNQDNPVSTIMSNFVGFRSSKDTGRNLQPAVREVKQINKSNLDATESKKETALQFINEIRSTPKEQKKALLQKYVSEGRMDEQTATYVVQALKGEKEKPLTDEGTVLKTANNKVKAEYIFNKIQDMEPEQKKEYLNKLMQDKILTDNVANELIKFLRFRKASQDLPLISQ